MLTIRSFARLQRSCKESERRIRFTSARQPCSQGQQDPINDHTFLDDCNENAIPAGCATLEIAASSGNTAIDLQGGSHIAPTRLTVICATLAGALQFHSRFLVFKLFFDLALSQEVREILPAPLFPLTCSAVHVRKP